MVREVRVSPYIGMMWLSNICVNLGLCQSLPNTMVNNSVKTQSDWCSQWGVMAVSDIQTDIC